jgi:hypothetical protein
MLEKCIALRGVAGSVMECWGECSRGKDFGICAEVFWGIALGRNLLIMLGEMRFGETIKCALHCIYCIQVVTDRKTNVFPVA